MGFGTVRFGDSGAYLFGAKTLAEQGRYPDRTDAYFFRPPGYPFFLAIAMAGHTDCIACAKVANCILGSAAALLLAALSARIFRRRLVAIATGIFAAIHPSFVLLSTDVQSEPLFLLLLLLTGFLLLAAADRPSTNLAVAAGACLALSALTRSSALALAPLLLAPLSDRRYPFRVRAHLGGAALLGFFFTLMPWTLRNALVYHELIPVSDMGGLSLYHGNSIWTRRYYELKSREEYTVWIDGLDRDMRRHQADMEREGKRSPSQRSGAFARMAIDESLADPAASLRTLVLKSWHWLRPYPTPWFWPAWAVAGTGLLYVALDALAWIGLLRCPRRGVASFCVAFLVLSMAVHVLMVVVWRYRVPYWDPVLILYGAFGALRNR